MGQFLRNGLHFGLMLLETGVFLEMALATESDNN
jgi:hypothetical protein